MFSSLPFAYQPYSLTTPPLLLSLLPIHSSRAVPSPTSNAKPVTRASSGPIGATGREDTSLHPSQPQATWIGNSLRRCGMCREGRCGMDSRGMEPSSLLILALRISIICNGVHTFYSVAWLARGDLQPLGPALDSNGAAGVKGQSAGEGLRG